MKTSTYFLVVFSAALSVAAAAILYDIDHRKDLPPTPAVQTIPARPPQPTRNIPTNPLAAELRARRFITPKPVVANLYPAGIYIHTDPNTEGPGSYFGSGIMRIGARGPELITVERSMPSADPRATCIFEVKLFNQALYRRLFFSGIRMRGGGSFNAADHIVIVALSETPRIFRIPVQPFNQTLQTGWGSPDIGGTPITRVRSLFTGKRYDIVGLARKPGGSGFIIADYNPEQGEGGEGFMDDQGRIWFLLAWPNPDQVAGMKHDSLVESGRNLANGIALLTGPVVKAPDAATIADADH